MGREHYQNYHDYLIYSYFNHNVFIFVCGGEYLHADALKYSTNIAVCELLLFTPIYLIELQEIWQLWRIIRVTPTSTPDLGLNRGHTGQKQTP